MSTHVTRVGIGLFQHEVNSFCPRRADMAAFTRGWLAYGDDVLRTATGTATELAGALHVLGQQPRTRVIPLMAATTGSSGPIEQATYQALRDDLLARIEAALPLDGVLLVLHGAMTAGRIPDASGDILRRVRQMVGPDVPVVATLDLHANVTRRMVKHATALVGYHTAPHVDQFETGASAARLLQCAMTGECHPRMALVRLPLIIPAENARHTDGPLSEVISAALEVEHSAGFLHASVYPVQPWMDLPNVGCSVLVVADGHARRAQREARRVASMLWERRDRFTPELVSASEAVKRAAREEARTIIFCDSADALTSGSTGDGTVILRAILEHGALPGRVLLNIVDAPAVAQAVAAGAGATVSLSVGGQLAPQYFQPLAYSGRVQTISDGVFAFKGPGSRGLVQRMGRAVVVQHDSVSLLIMERGVSQWDPEMYRSVGLEPAGARIVQVKSPAAFRAAYAGIFDEIIVIDAPGAASPKLASLPWRRLDRRIYPLNSLAAWPDNS